MSRARSPFEATGLPGSGDGWVEGGSRAPLPLADPRRVWVVRRGHFDVFGATVVATSGRRTHLFRAETGDTLLGIEPTEDAYGLLAVGSLDSAVEAVDPDTTVDSASVENWIASLCRAATEPTTEWPDAVVAPGCVTLPADRRLTADSRHVHWIEVTSGSVRLLARGPVGAGEQVPLAAQAWIAADGDAVLSAAVHARIAPAALSLFNGIVLGAVAERVRLRLEAESRAAAAGQETSRREFDAAMRDLAGAAAARSRRSRSDGSGDPLDVALGEIFRALHLPDRQPAAARRADAGNGKDAPGEERLELALQRFRLGRRRVVLKPDFQRFQGPPLLAWRGEERTPVALVYRERGGWQITDAEGSRPLRRSEAGELAADAVQIYPNLPAGPIRFGSLFGFGRADATPDLVRLGVGLAAVGLLGLTIPIWSHYLISTVIPGGRVNMLATVIGALLATTLGGTVFELFKGLALLRTEARLEARLQPALIERLIRLPTGFYRKYSVGDITDRTLGIQTARSTLAGTAASAVLGGAFGLMSLVPLFYYEARLAFVALGLTAGICLVIAALAYGQLRHEREGLRHQGQLEGFVVQMLSGIAKLRAAAAEPRAMAQWARHFTAQRDRFVSAQRWGAALAIAMAVLPILATATLYAFIAGYLHSDLQATSASGQLGATVAASFTAADFVAFSTAFGQVMGSLSGMTYALTKMLAVVPLVERARPLLETPIEVSQDAEPPGALSGAVELKRVRFRYAADGPIVLDDLSLRVEPGQFVALVGPSGSGKSTIARLILGFERPETGDVFFGARSAEGLDMPAVREQIGVVLQHGRLSSGSVFDNIVEDSSLGFDAAWAAARQVGLDQDIEQMPMGMHTVLLDGGATLSGGQRQRILIARALVRQPRILLLDEATSALDNRTQAVVTDTLGGLSITRIVIAHRLSTIQAVDRIFVLEQGRLVESGTYRELLAKDGQFAAMAKRQLL